MITKGEGAKVRVVAAVGTEIETVIGVVGKGVVVVVVVRIRIVNPYHEKIGFITAMSTGS